MLWRDFRPFKGTRRMQGHEEPGRLLGPESRVPLIWL